jgi:hypothetical protein
MYSTELVIVKFTKRLNVGVNYCRRRPYPNQLLFLLTCCAQIGVWLGLPVLGQVIVDQEKTSSEEQIFSSPAGGPYLACQAAPLPTVMDYTFAFRSGYAIAFPLSAFDGPGHRILMHVRVTPQGQQPVYLVATGLLPPLPEMKGTGQITGRFLVGRGSYTVDLVVEDDSKRSCRAHWRVQTGLTDAASGLGRSISNAHVQGAGEINRESQNGPLKSPCQIKEMTILLNAAPLDSKHATLAADETRIILDSLSSVVRNLAPHTVHLIVYNLDRQKLLFRTNTYTPESRALVEQALRRNPVGVVEYSTLKPDSVSSDLLANVVKEELQTGGANDALILIGPPAYSHNRSHGFSRGQLTSLHVPTFYLRYGIYDLAHARERAESFSDESEFRSPLRRSSYQEESPSDMEASEAFAEGNSLPPVPYDLQGEDILLRFVERMKGTILAVRNSADLASAIKRMESMLSKSTETPK